MKLTVFFLIVAFLNVSAKGVSQNVTLSGKNLPLEKIFKEVKRQTGYVFLYPETVMENARPVSIQANDLPLSGFLERIFKTQPLKYTVSSKTIYVSPAENTAERESKLLSELPANNAPSFTIMFLNVSGYVVDEQGRPIAGASVVIKGNAAKGTSTDANGYFELNSVDKEAVLIISGTNIETFECKVDNRSKLGKLVAVLKIKAEDDLEVVINTGYQKLKPNEMAGAVEMVTKKMLMEQTGSTIMERLNGMIGSLNFSNKVMPGNSGENPNSVLNMTIRGYSTINGTTDPLIILNNFPYTGDLDNIDPNDVENIVILKDAAATAMWGIRAANGVIVITTSGAKFGQKTRVSYRSTVTTRPKPDLSKIDVADGPEVYDFIAEIQGKSLPDVLRKEQNITELEYVGWQYYKGHITEQEFNEKLDRLKAIHPREQWSDLLYRNGLSINHSLNISGGSDKLSWIVSVNRDDHTGVLQDKSNRNNVRMNTAFKINEKLRLEVGIGYTKSYNKTGAPAYNSFKQSIRYQGTLGLVNPDGTPYGWYTTTFNPIHMDTVAGGLLGDLRFYPLTDWKYHYTTTNLESYIKNARLVYTPLKGMDIALNVQSIDQHTIVNNRAEDEAYFTRYNVALHAVVDQSRGVVTYQLPKGEIHRIRNNYANSFNSRLDINYRKEWGKGTIVFNGAFDLSEAVNKSDGQFLVGYVETPRKYAYPNQLPEYSTLRGGNTNTGNMGVELSLLAKEITQRNISTTASLAYIYDNRYILNINARRDGANILGVNVNERWKPNYSIAANWRIHNERFFNIPQISNLTAGISFGYVGNVDVSKSSRIVADALGYHAAHTELPGYFRVAIPPNPELRWEKTAHTNIKLDIGLFKDRIQLFTNYFVKNISDLYQNMIVDPLQALPGNYVANAGKMQVKGYEVNLTAQVIKSPLKYDITFSTANMKEKIIYYPNGKTLGDNMRGVLGNDGVALASLPALLANMPLYSIFSIAGKNSGVNSNGEYEIEYDGQRFNNASNLLNYIIGNNKADYSGIRVHGTATPTFTAGMHHRFNYKNWFLLVSLQAEMGHYFKYPVDRIGYHELSLAFNNRWRKPGDEAFTNIPKYTSPQDPSWNNYAFYSGLNIMKGDVIRLNNIQLSYTVPTRKLRMLNVALNAQNLGAIWTANKHGYDYRYLNYMTWGGQDKYFSFTLNLGF